MSSYLHRIDKILNNGDNMKYEDMTDMSNVPSHIAIIMDGNGRWAKKRLLPRSVGHKAGADTLKKIVRKCNDIGVKYLTVYAFSTENWSRPTEEVTLLMGLIVTYLQKEVREMNENNVRIRAIGDINKLPAKTYDELKKAMDMTKDNTGAVLSLALNYGFRDDLAHAIKNIISEGIDLQDINGETVKKYLYTSYMPDPDLIIRTGGEVRLSNFMLYEASYSEMYFCDTLWPDFDEESLYKAIHEYQKRDRRFGNVK